MKKRQLLLNATCLILVGFLAACHGMHKPMDGSRVGNGAGSAQTYASGSHGGAFGVLQNRKCKLMVARGGTRQHYFFAFNSSEINPMFKNSLHNQATYLIRHPNVRMRLEGNTDDRGSREYNVALSWRRARAISRVLKQEGISSRRMELVSYGAEKPAALGESEAAWRCNRRVDLLFKR